MDHRFCVIFTLVLPKTTLSVRTLAFTDLQAKTDAKYWIYTHFLLLWLMMGEMFG